MRFDVIKNIISTILCWTLFISCLSGCSLFDKESKPMDLDGFLTKMQKDSEEIEKIEFSIMYQDLNYEFKASDKYNNDNWTDSSLLIVVGLDCELAANKYWYIYPNSDYKTIANSFYNRYKNKLSEAFYFVTNGAIYFLYNTEDSLSDALTNFYADYEIFKQWANLDYVTLIGIVYTYSMPGSYFDNV